MPYPQLARDIHDNSGIRTDVTAAVLREFVEYVKDQVRCGKSVRVPGLGIIRPSYRRPKEVVCNLPHPKLRGQQFRTPLRITAFLQPAEGFLREEFIEQASGKHDEQWDCPTLI